MVKRCTIVKVWLPKCCSICDCCLIDNHCQFSVVQGSSTLPRTVDNSADGTVFISFDDFQHNLRAPCLSPYLSDQFKMSWWGSAKVEEPVVINEAEKLSELRKLLRPEISSILNDEDCLRFLRSNKFDMSKSYTHINKWGNWWNVPFPDWQIENKNLKPSDLLTQLPDNKEHLATEVFLWNNTGEDKEGRPIYWEKTGFGKD